MPTPTKGPRLGGGPAHERLILANLATALFEHGRIRTTEAKAKRLRPVAEKLITTAKKGQAAYNSGDVAKSVHAQRQVKKTVRDNDVVYRLFTEIVPLFENRDGGYLRITKIGPRKGDNAPMAVIELVTEQVSGSAAAARTTTAPAAAPAEEAAEDTTDEAAATEAEVEEPAEETAEADTADEPAAEAEEQDEKAKKDDDA